MKLVVTRKSHTRREKNGPVTYVAGQSFDGTAGELKAFGDRLEAASAKQEPKGEGKKAEKPAKQEPKAEADGK